MTAVALARGANLTLPYVNPKEVDRLQATVAAVDLKRIRLVPADLSDEAAVISLINSHERLDATIHLVGGFSMGATPDFSYADWRAAIELNLHTTFLICKHSLRKMLEQDYGRIVTVGSRGAEQPAGQLAAYCAAKAGVVALTKAIAGRNERHGRYG